MGKVIIAAGGTGGHLFPAQALARDLLQKTKALQVLFVGGDLGSNRCFHKESFPFVEIHVATPFRRGLIASCLTIFKGLCQCLRLLRKEKPKLVVGFGSYHSFPMLLAALLSRVPFVLFESDTIPGKVNRLFARWSKLNAVQFSQAASLLNGTTFSVNVPLWEKPGDKKMTREEARAFFCLSATQPTLLVFGGSQGSKRINEIFCEGVEHLSKEWQVIHLTGKGTDSESIRNCYLRSGIKACVKEFEDRMHVAWSAADFVICRSGAVTLAELIAFEVPGIVIPYPHAADNHQQKNALLMEKEIGGCISLDEKTLTSKQLYESICEHFTDEKADRMRENLRFFKKRTPKEDLSTLIYPFLC